jgi:hypothetical protein
MHFFRFLTAHYVLLLFASAPLPAQVTGSGTGEAAHFGAALTNNLPYTLTRTSTIVQTLANGAIITRTFSVKSARDAEGRMYSEERLASPSGVVSYIVFDPVSRRNVTWNNRTKIAVVTHWVAPESEQAAGVDAAQQPRNTRVPKGVTREDIGLGTIAGLEATGTRTTVIVPTGDVGNDRPFTVVSEKWISTRYEIPLLTVIDDPRSGERTDEVTEFHPWEPDSALFKIPEGYTVRERNAN